MTRRSLSVSFWKVAVVAAAAVGLCACGGDNVETAQQALTAVQSSQTTCATLGSSVHACMATMHTCVAAAADATAEAACKTALASCLPADAPPPGGPGGHPGGHHGGPGGHPGGHHGGPGGPGGHHGGGDMAGGCPGMDGAMTDACDPGAPVIEACAANLDTCLAAGGSAGACVVTADECVVSAIQDRFDAACEAHVSAACDETSTDSDGCAALSRACNDGVTLPAPVSGVVAIPILRK